MKKIYLASLVLAALGFVLGCAPKGENPEHMIAAARALDQQFVAAYGKGDVDGVMATYWNSPDLVSYPPDAMETRGWRATRENLTHFFATVPGADLELTEMNYKVAGDMVLSWGRWRLTMTSPAGESTAIEGRYSDVKAKRDGKWVYILDHASVPLPPPPGTGKE